MDKALKSFLKRHSDEAALFLQTERRDASQHLVSEAHAAIFFRNRETADEFLKLGYGRAEMFTVPMSDGSKVCGIPVPISLAREIRDIKEFPSGESKPRSTEQSNGGAEEKNAGEAETPRRPTAREFEEMTSIFMRKLQSGPHTDRPRETPAKPSGERVAVIGGFRADKLQRFLEDTLAEKEADGPAGALSGEEGKKDGAESSRYPRGSGWRRR